MKPLSSIRPRKAFAVGAMAARHLRAERPLDWIVQSANALLALGVAVAAPALPHAAAFAAGHGLLAVFVWQLGRGPMSLARPLTPRALLRHWLPAAFVVLMYFELGVLVPLLRSYDDFRYDRALQAIDVWLLGDPPLFVARHASRALSDVLMLCYFAYYPLALAVPAALYARGERAAFERSAAVILMGFLVSYAGYLAWPAVGPHRLFDLQRPSVLDGFGFSRLAYEWLRAVPSEPPDAFPSGHALVALLAVALAWRWRRPLVYVVAPIAGGIVVATVYLRLHYIADVIAACALAPLCYWLGCIVTPTRDNDGGSLSSQPSSRPASISRRGHSVCCRVRVG
ncbi:MAG: phosphatase PAP2 family protein [Polyangiales bacterium]